MACVSSALRTCGLILYLLLNVCGASEVKTEPWIESFSVVNKTCTENVNNYCKYLLDVRGGEFLGHLSWRLTPNAAARGGACDVIYPNYELREIGTTKSSTRIEITVPAEPVNLFFCLLVPQGSDRPFGGKWIHQGVDLFLSAEKTAPSTAFRAYNDLDSTEEQQKTMDLEAGIQVAGDSSDELQESQMNLDLKENLIDQGVAINREQWVDLSHDIDVNRPGAPRPTREEANDIMIISNGQMNQYVPLSEANPEFSNSKYEKNSFNENSDINKGTNELNLGKLDVVNIALPSVGKANAGNVQELVVASNENAEEITEQESRVDLLGDLDFNTGSIRVENDVQYSDNLYLDHQVQSENVPSRRKRQNNAIDERESGVEMKITADIVPVKLEGLRVEESNKDPKIVDGGVPSVLAGSKVKIRLFGTGFTANTVIVFTQENSTYGSSCMYPYQDSSSQALPGSVSEKSALFEIIVPLPRDSYIYFICAKNLLAQTLKPSDDSRFFLHQGTEPWLRLATHNPMLPLWVTIILILICLTFSALFSGLNLGLMSLDRTDLKIIANTGTVKEKGYAKAIMPVRDHGNYLLCSILLGNVAVNSTFTILLDELTSGLFAVIFSTLSIVLLGEITPQAICSRHGLMIGAKSIMITKAVMAITAPLAFPVSKLLDYFLGEEIGSVYNRERLKELVRVTNDVNDLDKDEVNIISGALELRRKTVLEVMTKLEDVFMLHVSSVLGFETMSEIVNSGFSRIPVFEGSRSNIIAVLFIKDLAFVDPDDNTPLRTLCQFYQNTCNFVFEDTTLDVMFRQFKEGHKGHMAFVHRVNNEGEGDPFYETIGLVTLEDVIEELIQAEIVDETDVFMDNRSKRRRKRPTHRLQDFGAFAERRENHLTRISPQLTLATFQFLSTTVDAFRLEMVSETVLRRLLRQDIIHHIKLKGKEKKDPSTLVYTQGKPVDYFVLILEGRVEVTVGRENLVFEAGPFTYFGVQALTQNIGVAESPTPSAMGSLQNINMDAMLRYTFVPDYSVRAITELYYIAVKRSLYLAAKRATLMELTSTLAKGGANEQFDNEVDKLLQSLDEDGSINGDHGPPRQDVIKTESSSQISPLALAAAENSARAALAGNGDVVYRGERAASEEHEKLLQ